MPRRKQDTPQRLINKTGVAVQAKNSSDSDEIEPSEKSQAFQNGVDQESRDVRSDKLTDVDLEDDSNKTESSTTHKAVSSPTVTSKDMPLSTAADKSSPSLFLQDQETHEKTHSSHATIHNSTADNQGSSVSADTSLLEALAEAAATRSTMPSDVSQHDRDNGKSKEEFLSVPFKKRAQRSPVNVSRNCDEHPQKLPGSVQTQYGGLAPTSRNTRNSHSFRATEDPDTNSDDVETSTDVSNFTTEKASIHGENLNPSQLHQMNSMIQRQRELYAENAVVDNSWIKMQRTDNNCLSKSKAERYRWCVQDNVKNGNRKNQTADNSSEKSVEGVNSDMINLKKSFLMRSTSFMQDKLYSTVFTGASKFRCRDCGNSFSTLVDLTVHMSKTGHYRDENIEEVNEKAKADSNMFTKPKKRSMMELDDKESADKVLKCLGCGHSFDSLQDLSVHMIKTKHYEDVPSLRFYSQKNGFSASQPDEEKTFRSSQKNNNNITTTPPSDESEYLGHKLTSSLTSTESNSYNPLAYPWMCEGMPSASTAHTLAAQALLGFPTYATLPFANALNSYATANPAMAAATSLFLTAPWLTQMSRFGTPDLFSTFFKPHSAFASSMMQPQPAHPAFHVDVSTSSPAASATSVPKSYEQSHRAFSKSSPNRESSSRGSSRSHAQEREKHSQRKMSSPRAERHSPYDKYHRSNGDLSSPVLSSSSKIPSEVELNSSPLKNLEKLAYGKSFNAESLYRPSSLVSHNNAQGSTKGKVRSTTPGVSAHSPLPRPPVKLLNENYLCPDRRPVDIDESKQPSTSGLNYIKSLECTIQNAISKVNESSLHERKRVSEESLGCSEPSKKSHSNQSSSRSSYRSHSSSASSKGYNHSVTSISTPKEPSQDQVIKKSTQRNQAMEVAMAIQDSIAKTMKDPDNVPLNLITTSDRGKKSTISTGNIQQAPSRSLHSQSVASSDTDNPVNSADFDPSSKDPQTAKTEKNRNEFSPHRSHTSSRNDAQHVKSSPPQTRPQSDSSFSSSHIKRGCKRRADNLGETAKCRDDEGHIPMKRTAPERNHHIHVDKCKGPHDTVKSSPLEEMQKIVDSTQLSRRSESSTDEQTDHSSKGDSVISSLTGAKSVNSKRFPTSSVLSDLIVHEGDADSSPLLNPLTQMENLVNLQVLEKSSPVRMTSIQSQARSCSAARNHVKTYANHNQSESLPKKMKALQKGSNPMSALLHFFDGANNKLSSSYQQLNSNPARRASDTSLHEYSQQATQRMRKKDKQKPNSPCADGESGETERQDFSLTGEPVKLQDKMANFFRSMAAEDKESHMGVSGRPNREVNALSDSFDKQEITGAVTPLSYTNGVQLRPNQEIMLQLHYVSNLERINEDEENEEIALKAGLHRHVVKNWMKNVHPDSRNGKTSFISRSASNHHSYVFKCTVGETCRSEEAIFSRQEFMQHLCKHLVEEFQPAKVKDEGEDLYRSKDCSVLFKGEMRIETISPRNNDFSMEVHIPSPNAKNTNGIRDLSPSPPSDLVHGKLHRNNGLKVKDEPGIQVSG